MMKIAVISLTFVFCLSLGHAEAQNISDEAMHHFDRGEAAIEMAKSPADYEDAVKEFDKAARLAPDWPDVYYNLGFIQEKLGKYDDAIKNLTKYLKLSPNASDSRAVKKFIAKMGYKKDKAKAEYDKIKDLLGTWDKFNLKEPHAGYHGSRYVITAKHGVIEINSPTSGYNIGSVQFDGRNLKFKYSSSDQGAWVNDFEYDVKIISKVLMRGYVYSKIVSVKYPDLAKMVGRRGRWEIELRKR